MEKAQQEGLDLVEVAPQVEPPVARITDFEKFRYKEEKREQAAKKHTKEVELKEIWLSPRIAQHDLETRLRKVNEFLEEGHKVKLTVRFKGREMAHPENGKHVVDQALGIIGGKAVIERETKFEGRNLTTIIGPEKQKKENDAKTENQTGTS